MARNIEIKARVAALADARVIALALGAVPLASEEQTDRYYVVDGAHRLKLRTIAGGRAELVEYRRPEKSGVRASDYTVTPVRDERAGICLVPKGEPLLIVRKRREILLWDNVRIHLDEVDQLGTFIELEAVLDEQHDESVCRDQVAYILRALGLSEDDLIRASYAELIQR
jgi:adenylate cyclase class IV